MSILSTNVPETFGARLVAERERLSLAQDDMKSITGVSRRAQFNYEQSVRLPDVGYLAALAKHGFDVSYLITGNRAPRNGTVNEDLLRDVFRAIETAVSAAGHSLDIEKKATLVALVYQASTEQSQIDSLIVQKALNLI
jgi:transcriptional regulator with XRE-family HTH domain